MQSSFISSKNFQSGTVQEFLNFAKSSIPRSAFSVVNDSCLKFGGTVGGQWPTPQVRSCTLCSTDIYFVYSILKERTLVSIRGRHYIISRKN